MARAKLKGLRKFNRKMQDMAKAADAAAHKAVIRGANRVADGQRAIVRRRSGKLAKSIHVTKPGEMPPKYSQAAKRTLARQNQALISAGNSRVRYAHLVEYGTKPHTNKGIYRGTRHPGTKAQPFFWPVWRAFRRSVRGGITRSINKAIKAVARRGGTAP